MFPDFTVIQLNRYKEHPGGCELALEEDSVKYFSWGTQEVLVIEINIFHLKILHTAFVTGVCIQPIGLLSVINNDLN